MIDSQQLGREKQIVAIDSQRLETMQFCLQAFEYKFNKGLVLINTPVYLERGGLIHEMLAQYYKLRKHQSRWGLNHKNYADIVNICIDVGRIAALKMQLDIAEVEDNIRVFKEYTELWENDGWNDVVAVENVGAKILYEDGEIVILYEVKIDLILNIAGRLIPIDHKSSSSRRDPNQLSNQFKGYCWFLGVNNLMVNEIGFQKTIKPVDKFRRHMLSFPDAVLAEWIDNSVWWVKHSLACGQAKIHPRNFSSCDKFSGCDFKHVCASEPGELREFKLRKDFMEREWSPGGKHL